jgi:hypothetical protein
MHRTWCPDAAVRTTITLDPDTDAAVRKLMRERGLTFKQAVNQAIRQGTSSPRGARVARTRTFPMGRLALPIDKALRLAADLKDEEIIRKLAQRK